MKRKLRKFVRQPRLFFFDFFAKKVAQLTKHSRKFDLILPRNKGVYKYSIVSAVYGVEKYLDDFFVSIINQSLDPVMHIELIMVDDGSIDNSAAIIKRWQKQYPGVIKYLRKENGGQASARNYGLEHVTGDYVTFIDPDDFINLNYFEKIDNFLAKHALSNIALVCCNIVFFMEKGNRFVDRHPTNFRFKKGNRIVDPFKDPNFMTSTGPASLFKSSVIRENKICFSEQIKPNFEDAHFVGQYLLFMSGQQAAYLKSTRYYYRKRSDGTSTSDSGWEHLGRFSDVLSFGYIPLLQQGAKKFGAAPLAIQRLILYDIMWIFKKAVNTPSAVDFLTGDQQRNFLTLSKEVFEYIDASTIENSSLAGAWHYHKVGFLGMMKGSVPNRTVVYLDGFDPKTNSMKLQYFYHGQPPLEEFRAGKNDLIPEFAKTRRHEVFGATFLFERSLWLSIPTDGQLSAIIDGRSAELAFNGKRRFNVDLKQVALPKNGAKVIKLAGMPASVRVLRYLAHAPLFSRPYQNAWMLMDRQKHGDDSAEHLYKYIISKHPEINVFFVIDKNSSDWQRLQDESFRLIPFGSFKHKLLMANAAHLISSHADAFMFNVLPDRWFADMKNFKFTFLQHGVIRDDISKWLNAKKIDLFVSSSPAEYQAIVKDESPYKFSSREVKVLGLSRHDGLLQRTEEKEKVILIMPTWRQALIGQTSSKSGNRIKVDRFYKSLYAKTWKSLLHSEHLKKLAVQYGYKVVFFPHINMQVYMDWFAAPEWVEMRTHETDPILQKLFRRAALMITDYSSVFFEFGVLARPIIYYQFDFDLMYGGMHISRQGYLDFKKDGLGPVAETEDELLKQIEKALARECKAEDVYLDRMQKTLPCRSGNNRQRTIEAIKNLDSSSRDDAETDALLIKYAQAASGAGNWLLATERWTRVMELPKAQQPAAAAKQLAKAKLQLSKVSYGNVYTTDLSTHASYEL